MSVATDTTEHEKERTLTSSPGLWEKIEMRAPSASFVHPIFREMTERVGYDFIDRDSVVPMLPIIPCGPTGVRACCTRPFAGDILRALFEPNGSVGGTCGERNLAAVPEV